MSKYIDTNKLIAEIERLKGQLIYGACAAQIEMETNCKDDAYNEVLSCIASLQQEQPECIEKTARISAGLLSNFGTSTYVLDVDLTQYEMAKVAPFGFNSGKIKIKIVCE